jgi:hypothetical protein
MVRPQSRSAQALAQCYLLGEAGPGQRAGDEGALAGLAGRQASVLKLAVCLLHRVRVDRQRLDSLPDGRQAVSLLEVTEPKGLFDLLNQLQVGRDPGRWVQPESDGRDFRRRIGRLPGGRRSQRPPALSSHACTGLRRKT